MINALEILITVAFWAVVAEAVLIAAVLYMWRKK